MMEADANQWESRQVFYSFFLEYVDQSSRESTNSSWSFTIKQVPMARPR
jgi:hypothetical protein